MCLNPLFWRLCWWPLCCCYFIPQQHVYLVDHILFDFPDTCHYYSSCCSLNSILQNIESFSKLKRRERQRVEKRPFRYGMFKFISNDNYEFMSCSFSVSLDYIQFLLQCFIYFIKFLWPCLFTRINPKTKQLRFPK